MDAAVLTKGAGDCREVWEGLSRSWSDGPQNGENWELVTSGSRRMNTGVNGEALGGQ